MNTGEIDYVIMDRVDELLRDLRHCVLSLEEHSDREHALVVLREFRHFLGVYKAVDSSVFNETPPVRHKLSDLEKATQNPFKGGRDILVGDLGFNEAMADRILVALAADGHIGLR